MKAFLPKLIPALLALLCLDAAAVTRYVALNSPNPTPPYTNWPTAATNIQVAIDAAAAGDLVLVSNGVYQTGGRIVLNVNDATSNRVAVTKAVTVQSVNGPLVTLIQGYKVPGTTNGINAIRCVYLTTNAIVSGFTLTNGAVRTDSLLGKYGGGASCQSTGAVVSNCLIVGNAAVYGGGSYLGTFNNCVFSNNVAQNDGGGGTGGIYNNCLFIGNAALNGGAVIATSLPGILKNCTVYGNAASVRGGGLADISLSAPGYLWVSNCIVYGNTSPDGSNYFGGFGSGNSVRFSYCCASPVPAGTGNFANDPLFVNRTAGNLRLQTNSLCINSGLNAYAVGSTDLDGLPRIVGGTVDVGAYEYQLPAPAPLIPTIQATYTGVSTGIVVGFTGQIAGQPSASRWDFGDGTVISNHLPNVTHSWSVPGDYVAALWAYNSSYPTGVNAGVVIHVLRNPVHFVSQNSTNPVAPYLSWSNAAMNIQDAVDAAYISGTVVVSNGVYSTGGAAVQSVSSGYWLTNRVTVLKPITLRSLNGPAVTTIQGYQVPGTTNGNSAVRCVYLTNNTTLIGFTLASGATRIYTGQGMDYARVQSGGGVYAESNNAVISNCVMIANAAYIGGGGAYSGALKNCLLTGNASERGGGAFSSMLENCVLTGNSALWGGGAFWLSTLNNCTLVGNIAVYQGGGASYSALNNCILHFNDAPSGTNFDDSSLPCTLNYCSTTPLPASGNGNFTNSPLFLDVPNGNFRLQFGSPCINAGNNAYATSTIDLDGRPRNVTGTVDVGAYEFQGAGMGEFIAWLGSSSLPTDGSADFTDADGDGANNWKEWRSDTIPTNALSVLRMVNATNSPAGAKVTWQSVSTRNYWLERATNLGAASPFQSIATNIAGVAGTKTFTDTSATNGGSYFYRVGVQ